MKATMASLSGRPWSGFGPTYRRTFPALFFTVLTAGTGFAAGVLAAAATGARALLVASDFGLPACFLAAAFFAGFGTAVAVAALDGFSAFFSVSALSVSVLPVSVLSVAILSAPVLAF